MLFRGSSTKSTKPQRILICTPEGDYHEFGILQAALLCNHYKLPFFYLGPNLPVESLLDAYRSLEANMVLVGSTIIPENKSSDFVNSYFETVAKSIGNGELLVGGNNHIDKARISKHHNSKAVDSMHQLDDILKSL